MEGGVGATCCVRTHKRRDGTVTNKFSQENARALALSCWISLLMFAMLRDTTVKDKADMTWWSPGRIEWVPLGHGHVTRRPGQLCLGKTLKYWEGHLGSSRIWIPCSTMRLALLALRLTVLAWLWPVTQLNSSPFTNKKRHKEVYVGESSKVKHGG